MLTTTTVITRPITEGQLYRILELLHPTDELSRDVRFYKDGDKVVVVHFTHILQVTTGSGANTETKTIVYERKLVINDLCDISHQAGIEEDRENIDRIKQLYQTFRLKNEQRKAAKAAAERLASIGNKKESNVGSPNLNENCGHIGHEGNENDDNELETSPSRYITNAIESNNNAIDKTKLSVLIKEQDNSRPVSLNNHETETNGDSQTSDSNFDSEIETPPTTELPPTQQQQQQQQQPKFSLRSLRGYYEGANSPMHTNPTSEFIDLTNNQEKKEFVQQRYGTNYMGFDEPEYIPKLNNLKSRKRDVLKKPFKSIKTAFKKLMKKEETSVICEPPKLAPRSSLMTKEEKLEQIERLVDHFRNKYTHDEIMKRVHLRLGKNKQSPSQ